MTASIFHLYPIREKSATDPILSAEEERKSLQELLANLPNGDEAADIYDRLIECELRIISQTAQTRAGLIIQITLLKSWIEGDGSSSRDADLAAAAVVMAGIYQWAGGTLDARGARSWGSEVLCPIIPAKERRNLLD
jgi:hypothetical protein